MSLNSIWWNENLNEKKDTQEVEWKSFDSEKYSQELAAVGQEINETRKLQLENADELKKFLTSSEKEKVENFIGQNCCEPIENVNRIVPYKELVGIIIQSAREEFERVESSGYDKGSIEYKNAFEVRNKLRLFTLSDEEKAKLSDDEKKQMKWLAKDQRIYELPAYKNLIEKWFIIPSDIRTSYDSAEQKPVQHLWVDYNVKAWTAVKSIYDWKVVESCLDWWLGHKVIIEHEIKGSWKKFYSLYGHIWSEWLPKIWDDVKKWDIIWKVGQAFTKDNWDWEEHLHFQIMENKDSPEWYSKELWETQIWNYDVLKAFSKE